MKKLIFLFLFFILVIGSVWFFWPDGPRELISPLSFDRRLKAPGLKSLEEYAFENLRNRDYRGSEIVLEKVIKEEEKYVSWLFSYFSDGKRVTGMANLPRNPPAGGVVIMLRGYADDDVYFTGLGTRKAAGIFAENGFLTLAPDFLGFGDSDFPSDDILETRFNRPVEVLNLLASISSLPNADPEKIVIWAHSNGGQIALSVLEIGGQPIPTTLWAPVTRGFPQSILDYMGELDDLGKKVKKAIDEFVKRHEAEKYSIDNYFADITAPIQVHQGLADYLIKNSWTDEFVETMKGLGKEVAYYKYPGNDHNLKQSWDKVVERDLMFFQSFL